MTSSATRRMSNDAPASVSATAGRGADRAFAATDPRAQQLDLTGRTIAFLHAHPDDEAIFTGVTMRRLADHGARVVLVTATAGEEGQLLAPLRHGRTTADQRVAELERACAELGVARLVLLPYRDSGMPGTAANRHPRAFALQPEAVARLIADVLHHERVEALVHYDRGALLPSGRHLIERAAPRSLRDTVGSCSAQITTVIEGTGPELDAKRSAMAAHESQIPPSALVTAHFAATYATEWFTSAKHPGLLDLIATAGPSGRVAVA
jgi:LmbE family N-acetylglucosaminyl deacetylase